MAINSSGQITIVDQNDAKPILANISASGVLQQSYSKDNAVELFSPNWVSTPLTLTANIYVGGVNVAAGSSITGKQWSTTFDGADLGTGVTQVRNTNFTTPSSVSSQTYYFRCTYTDPVTLIPSRVDAQISVGCVTVGSNAVYVDVSGVDVIQVATSSTKNVAVIKAQLVRSSGVDTDNLQYRWYSISQAGVATKLHSAVANVANYGIMSTAIGNAPSATSANLGAATFTTAGMATAGVTTVDADWSTAGSPGYNTLVVSENAVSNYQLFKVEVRDSAEPNDATAPVYVGFFTVYDVSDPVTLQLSSANGDRLLNGTGSSQLTAKVINGVNEIASYTGWSMDWFLRDRYGNRTGFVMATTPPTPDIVRTITANTTGGLTLGAVATLAAGDLVKMVSVDGAIVKFAQVAATTTTAVVLQAATGDNALCNPVSAIVANEFVNGTMYKAISRRTFTGTPVGVMISQYDIDGKGTIEVAATLP
jgi:hypothetical protein